MKTTAKGLVTMRHALIVGFLLTTVGSLSGCSTLCCGIQNLEHPYVGGGCCEDKWDPILGTTSACGVCGGPCQGHTPAQALKHTLTCSSGCGEIYWGEWISDPPDKCDPCDLDGNWIGSQPCCTSFCDRLKSGYRSLFGHRATGCEDCLPKLCPDGCKGISKGEVLKGETIIHSDDAVPESDAESWEGSLEELRPTEPTPDVEAEASRFNRPYYRPSFNIRSSRNVR